MLIRKERLEKIVEKKIRDRILEISTEEVEIKSLVGRRIIVLNDSASWISEGTVYENTFSEYEFINRLSKDVIFCRCFGSPYSLKAVRNTKNIYILSTPQGSGSICRKDASFTKRDYLELDKFMNKAGV